MLGCRLIARIACWQLGPRIFLSGLILSSVAAAWLSSPALVWGAEVDQVQQTLVAGDYPGAIELAEDAIRQGEREEEWRLLKIQAEMTLGRYDQARQTLEKALRQYPSSVRLRLLGYEVYAYNNQYAQAEIMLKSIADLARRTPWRYQEPSSQVALGRYFLLQGADPRQVLEAILDRVRKQYPDYVDAYVSIAELALDKHDYALAADTLTPALKLEPDNPQLHYLLARSFASSDPQRAETALRQALEQNPRHVPSLLLQADLLVDSERYDDAEEILEQVSDVNQHHPRVWALRAVIAHLRGDEEAETAARERGLEHWTRSPLVDHEIGRQLSRHYRFAEGARYQRRALARDPNHLPSKMQLSQDLLRLGDPEGWELVAEVNSTDGYNVVAHNLLTLRDHLDQFRTLEADGLIVRMDRQEAELYGERVLELLTRARAELCEKYEVELTEPVVVEIFPQQQDFAIRTFGLPGGDGFLGVCFGRLITANSPASLGEHASNWESVLWHEFCHVVTLEKTNNKMPRWLSEGISVYEERQEDPRWGQSMDRQYRAMILGGELTPVSKLSEAFLQPKSGLHLQFAYYESSLVVEYLVEQYELATLRRVLTDLGVGMPINETLGRYVGSIEQLDQEFADYARQRAEQFAAEVDWEPADVQPDAELDELASWVRDHPHNIDGLNRYASALIADQQYEQAKEVLQELLRLDPTDTSADSPYLRLAEIHRRLGETQAERSVLEELAVRASDALPAYVRLMELGTAAEDWEAVADFAQQMLAVNPLLPAPHQHLARAAGQLGDVPMAIDAYEALLVLDPVDPAEAHYQLARLLHKQGASADAKRHVLAALEEAPRYRQAHQLLLQIVEPSSAAQPARTSN